jgi:hypothetical protein
MRLFAMGISVLCVVSVFAQAQSGQKAVPKPDLHAGGAKPSLIPNHEITTVTLPGLHLSGATLTVNGVCTLKSYKVTSDTQIQMILEGHRAIDDKEDGCFLHVHQGSFQTGTYVIVDLTQAEWDEKQTKERAANKAQGEAYMASLGKQWVVHYANGSSETFVVQPADEGELPDYTSASGATAKFAITGGKVVMMAGSCMRSGILNGSQVKDGTSMGDCKPAGAWSAEKR